MKKGALPTHNRSREADLSPTAGEFGIRRQVMFTEMKGRNRCRLTEA